MSDAPELQEPPSAEAGGCRRLIGKGLLVLLVLVGVSALVGYQLYATRRDELLASLQQDREELARPRPPRAVLRGEPREGNGAALYSASGALFHDKEPMPELAPEDAALTKGPRVNVPAGPVLRALFERQSARTGRGYELRLQKARGKAVTGPPVGEGPALSPTIRRLVDEAANAIELMRRAARCQSFDTSPEAVRQGFTRPHLVAAERARSLTPDEAVALGIDLLAAPLGVADATSSPSHIEPVMAEHACWILAEALMRGPSPDAVDALAAALDRVVLPDLRRLLLLRAVYVGRCIGYDLGWETESPEAWRLGPGQTETRDPVTHALGLVQGWSQWRSDLTRILDAIAAGRKPDSARLQTMPRQARRLSKPEYMGHADVAMLVRIHEELSVRIALLKRVVAAHRAQRQGKLPTPGPAGTVGYGRSVTCSQSGEFWIWRAQVGERTMAAVTRFPAEKGQ